MIRALSTLLFLSASALLANDWSEYYSIEEVPLPDNVDHQIGGLVSLRDGRMAACFNSGEVMIYNPAGKEWTRFAQGLQCPLGIVEDDDGSLVVMQWSELTRLSDTDSDGEADFYQTVWNDFGVSGNYHEFAFGPARDKQGNYYVGLNVASNFAGTFKKVRGPVTPIGLDPAALANWKDDPDWPTTKLQAGRMFSRVPYRGCVMKITPDGNGAAFAYGFRSPNGLGLDDEGRLWVTDNQGDWRGTSPLYHVTHDGFYGHPASLVWKPAWTRPPLEMPVEELQAMRTPAAGLFPQGELANSPTQPIPTIDPNKFGLPKGELLIGEMNQPTLIRFLDDEIDGTVQGAMIPFLLSSGIGRGNHRLSFNHDGSLWVGKIHLGWAGDEGLKHISWNGTPLFLVEQVKLLESGFRIFFNNTIGKTNPKISIERHTYSYHSAYGSPKVDLQKVSISKTKPSEDRRSINLTLPEIDEGYLYTIRIEDAKDAEANPLMGDVLRYNVVKARR